MIYKYKLVLIRHGESIWNKENRFTGWMDISLTEKGILDAYKAGSLLKQKGYTFDIVYTSVLKRAIKTLWNMQEAMDLMWLPAIYSWRLNERHYGKLMGLNKTETAIKFGEQQVLRWRRSYTIAPPPLNHNESNKFRYNSRYKNVKIIPLTESLKDTVDRVVLLWNNSIIPLIKSGKYVLIVAHGNSLRALIKHIDNITDDDIVKINIPNTIPLVYEFDELIRPINNYYLYSE